MEDEKQREAQGWILQTEEILSSTHLLMNIDSDLAESEQYHNVGEAED